MSATSTLWQTLQRIARSGGCFTLVSNDSTHSAVGQERSDSGNTGVPLGAWLAQLPDERLIRLLELRPDLTQPPPGTIAALAARATSRQSVKAATDDLDFLRLAVLDALLVLHGDTTAVPLAKLFELIGSRADEGAITAAVDDLRDRALVWGDDEVRVAAEAASGLPWYPGQAVVETADLGADDIARMLSGLDTAQRDLLDRLLEGSPVGRTRDAAPGTPRTGRCSGCLPRACCDRSTTTP